MLKKILLIVAHEGYQHIEYNNPKEILTNAGFKVVTASDKDEYAVAKNKSKTKVDLTIGEINPEDYAGIFLIGGPGALDHLNNKKVHELLKKIKKLDITFGAICISPRILAQAGVLEGKNATGWDDDNELAEIFKSHKVNYIKKPVVIDEKVITATGPSAAKEFAEAIIKVIK